MGPLLGVVSVLTDIFIASTERENISHPFEKGTIIIFKVAFSWGFFLVRTWEGSTQDQDTCKIMVIVSPPKEGTASKLAYSFGGDHNLLSKWGDARICVAPFVWYQHQAELKSVVQI